MGAESTPDSQFDAQVQALCQAGDRRHAATLILRRLGTDVLRVICARFRDETQAAEVFSRFAEDLWLGLPQFHFRCAVRVWAFTLARNAGSRYLERELRKERRLVPISQAPELANEVQQVRSTTLARLRSENRERVAALRSTLAEDEQLLLSLRIEQKLGFREIALIMCERTDLDEADVVREAARLRKRFQVVKDRLKRLLQGERG